MNMQHYTADLIDRYAPVLVLFPEIGTTVESRERKENPAYPDESPLLFDYHPRDIKLVLDNTTLHQRFRLGTGQARGWSQLLDRMEQSDYANDWDVAPGVDPTDRESFWKVYADIADRDVNYQRRCYARVVQGSGRRNDLLVAQYWYPYFYNDFWNTHEMDWEVVMIVFKLIRDIPRPTVCAYSAHHGGQWLPWAQVSKADSSPTISLDGTHPIVYVANGSHANYFYGPSMFITAPPFATMAADLLKKNRRLVDYTTSWSEGLPVLVKPEHIPDAPDGVWQDEWRWLNQKGHCGSVGKWYDIEFGDSGPLPPPESGDRWDFPFRWVDTACTRAPSLEESLVPTRLLPE